MLVILAILARGVLPTGFMPSFDQDKIAITICHGAEIKTIYVDMDTHKDPSDQADQTCPYSPIAQSDTGSWEGLVLSYEPLEYTRLNYGVIQLADTHHVELSGQPRAPPLITL